MGSATLQADPQLVRIGSYLLIGGLVALVIGFVGYKATERSTDV